MKPSYFFCLFMALMLVLGGCSKESNKNGVLRFRTSNPLVAGQNAFPQAVISGLGVDNPPLTGHITATRTVSLRLTVDRKSVV